MSKVEATETESKEPVVPKRNITAFLVDTTKQAVSEGRHRELRLTVERLQEGMLIIHDSFFALAHQFCETYALQLGLTDLTKESTRRYLLQYYRTYYTQYKEEQQWSRAVVVDTVERLNDQGILTQEQQEIISKLIKEKDEILTKRNTIICLPSIYDDPSLYQTLGVTVEEWQQKCVPYLKKNAGGLVFASARYPSDIDDGNSVYSINGVETGHDSLTYDLSRARRAGLSFIEAAKISGLHEGHHSYLEYILSKLIGGGNNAFSRVDFIHEAFACFREGIGKERNKIPFGYDELIALLNSPNDSQINLNNDIYYSAAPKLLGAMHQLIRERDPQRYSDLRERYIYIEERGIVAALKVMHSGVIKDEKTATFIRTWISELGLTEDDIRVRFDELN